MNLFRLKDGNSTNHKFNERALLLLARALICFGLSHRALAQLPPPPPDGGYPIANTAEGDGALSSVTVSIYPPAGFANTALGYQALNSSTTGNGNTATGAVALQSNTTGSDNTATGSGSLSSNTTGNENTAHGSAALLSNTTGINNTATGFQALRDNTTGNYNTANGEAALRANTTGETNTATGFVALISNTIGNSNTATGAGALATNTTGDNNTANGFQTLNSNTTGVANTAVGGGALLTNTTGNGNIALGLQAGDSLTTGDNNIDIGNRGVAGEGGTIRIGTQGIQTRTFVAGITGAAVMGGAVKINAAGQLGTAPSSQRFKQNIKPMDKASEAILALKPVTFYYKKELDPEGITQFGLVAEQVEKVNPDLVARDRDGKPYTVRYEAVNAMLLNEFLKEHRKVQQLEKQVEKLTAGLQKVSAQVEMSKPGPRVADSN
jgi:trimeric autotransporter adhesin